MVMLLSSHAATLKGSMRAVTGGDSNLASEFVPVASGVSNQDNKPVPSFTLASRSWVWVALPCFWTTQFMTTLDMGTHFFDTFVNQKLQWSH